MARGRWLTPDGAIPEETICLIMSIPDGLAWRAALRGAFLLLAEEKNWQQYGSISPVEAADVFLQAFFAADYVECTMERFVGEIAMKAQGTVPPGWLAANGQEVSRVVYSDLFAVIGTVYGSSGADTFSLPNFGLRFPTGPTGGNLVGSAGGSNTHTLTVAQLPSHAHSHSHGNGLIQATKAFAIPAGSVHQPVFGPLHGVAEITDTDATLTGSGQAHNNIPAFLTMRFLIYAGPQAA